MNKQELVDSLRRQLRDSHRRALAALDSAAEGATGEDTRAESKYDTRGLEASYLAAGQAAQAEEMARILSVVEEFDFRQFTESDAVDVGALVAVEFEGGIDRYLLAPGGGGLTVEDAGGNRATVLGPGAPLAITLLGKRTGETAGGGEMTITGVS